jgi:uncharacterized membrane protein YozB (DUF420 family)
MMIVFIYILQGSSRDLFDRHDKAVLINISGHLMWLCAIFFGVVVFFMYSVLNAVIKVSLMFK